jgi:hypothetical protein
MHTSPYDRPVRLRRQSLAEDAYQPALLGEKNGQWGLFSNALGESLLHV